MTKKEGVNIALHLKSGQIIKNYISLCDLLGVKPTKGKGREYHIKELERHCIFKKEGRKFVIDQVFDKPLEKTDGRKNNGGHIANTHYELLMDNLILNLLFIEDIYNATFFNIFKDHIPMLSKEYSELVDKGYKNFAIKHNLAKGLVLTYYQKMRNIMLKSLETALNRLQKNDVITWRKNVMVNDCIVGKDIANDDLVKDIREHEKKTLKEMEITHLQLIEPRVNKKFKNNVCNKLESLSLLGYWNVYNIKLLDKNVGEVKTDIDDLINRFIKSIHKAVQNKTCINNFEQQYQPYMSYKNLDDIKKIDLLLWNLQEKLETSEEMNISL